MILPAKDKIIIDITSVDRLLTFDCKTNTVMFIHQFCGRIKIYCAQS
jgi:hypothetical protein